MGQMIMSDGGDGLFVVFTCDKCSKPNHWDMIQGTDFIKMRGEARARGWRQRAGKWFKDLCVPQPTKEDHEET